ncbi:hypothetical protein KUTeg_019784 [Tegillarca granosa]|uniref:Uncharacterized protein n=1 Tax=Tegillarca granosa TaxID=220873 RepID=A0ABQ9EJI9_TEGGR|nr:hypothetical protein KUTeg_019784 [Tegillarca granosa]
MLCVSVQEGWNIRIPSIPTSWEAYFNTEASMIYLGFIFCHVIFDLLPLGKVVDGQPMRDGTVLKYRCNRDMIHDFFVGHELSPRVGNFDLKWFSFRLSFHIWMMLDLLYLTKAWETYNTIPPTLALAALSQMFYPILNLYFEFYNELISFRHIMPYFYPLFLTAWLVDREKSDGEYCKQKYKKSWERYCEEVKYRIVPYVY